MIRKLQNIKKSLSAIYISDYDEDDDNGDDDDDDEEEEDDDGDDDVIRKPAMSREAWDAKESLIFVRKTTNASTCQPIFT